MGSERSTPDVASTFSGKRQQNVPSAEQFVILAQKVEELEDRIRSLAANDVDSLRKRIATQQKAVENLKSPRYWLGGAWRRLHRMVRGRIRHSAS